MADAAVWLYTWFPALFAIGCLVLVSGLLLLAWISGAREENRALDELGGGITEKTRT